MPSRWALWRRFAAIRASEIEEVGGKLITKVRDVLTEVVRFDEALQLPRLEPVNGYLRLVLVNVGGRQVGVVVEEVLRKDEIVIKNLGEYLRNVKLFPGATIAPDGSLILLVDVNRLIMGESIERRPLTTAMNAARLFLPGATAVARGEIPAAAVDARGEGKAGGAGRRFDQRTQVCGTHAGEGRLSRQARLRRPGGAGDCNHAAIAIW